MFFPSKLRAVRKKKLSPVLDEEVTNIKSRYLLADGDKVDKKQMNREIRAVHKKYRVTAGSGCLSAILQLPIYIALYKVVTSPELFVPAIRQLYTDPEGNAEIISAIQKLFDWSIDLSPLSLGVTAYVFPLMVCLFTLCGNRKAWRQQTYNGPKKKFFKWYTRSLLALQTVLLTCFSFKLPLGISIYWLSNDVMNIVLDRAAEFLAQKNKGIQKALNDHYAKKAHKAPESSDEPAIAEETADSDICESVCEGEESDSFTELASDVQAERE